MGVGGYSGFNAMLKMNENEKKKAGRLGREKGRGWDEVGNRVG